MAKLTNLSSIGRLIGQRAGFDQQLWLTERRVELIRELACYEGGLGVVRELEHGTLSELGAGKHLSGVLDVLAEPEVFGSSCCASHQKPSPAEALHLQLAISSWICSNLAELLALSREPFPHSGTGFSRDIGQATETTHGCFFPSP